MIQVIRINTNIKKNPTRRDRAGAVSRFNRRRRIEDCVQLSRFVSFALYITVGGAGGGRVGAGNSGNPVTLVSITIFTNHFE